MKVTTVSRTEADGGIHPTRGTSESPRCGSSPLPSFRLLALVAVALALLGGLLVATPPPVGADLLKINTADEVSLGREASAKFERKYPILEHGPLVERVRRIGLKVAAVSGRDLPYTFKVVDSPTINAITFPGGFIYFYRGLLEQNLTDDQVAGVLGHEIAHAVKSHTFKSLFVLGGIRKLAGRSRENAVSQVFSVVTVQGFSRRFELEADRLGAGYAYKAGYDPQGLLDVLELFQRLRKRNPSLTERLTQSHPMPEDRIRKLKPIVAQLKSTGR